MCLFVDVSARNREKTTSPSRKRYGFGKILRKNDRFGLSHLRTSLVRENASFPSGLCLYGE